MAHEFVAVVPGLSLHTVRRESGRDVADVSESGGGVSGDWFVARGGVDVCVLGGLSRGYDDG